MCIPSFLGYYTIALPAKLSICGPLKKMYVSDGNSHKIRRINSEGCVNICCLLETSHNYPRTFKTQPQKSHAVDNLLSVAFSGKSRRELIKMMSVLQTFRAIREVEGGQEYGPDCSCVQDNLLMSPNDCPGFRTTTL